jgi:hypothetical protein
MTSKDLARPTLRPPPADIPVANTKPRRARAERASPRAFLAIGALDALEHLCTGAVPVTPPETQPVPPPIPSDAPTVKAFPDDAE